MKIMRNKPHDLNPLSEKQEKDNDNNAMKQCNSFFQALIISRSQRMRYQNY